MADLEKIKEEIVEIVKQKYPEYLNDVNVELETMEITDGLEGKNNLETFYNLWKSKKGQTGSKNDINSWTAYALGLTTKKPDGEFLAVRRAFARAGFPDIDTDFDDEHRDDIYQYMIDKYGRENVGNIGTHGLLKFKSCMTRLIKTLDIANAYNKGKDEYVTANVIKVNEILEPFPKKGILKVRDEEGNPQIIKSVADANKYCKDFNFYMQKYPDLLKYSIDIEGGFANFGCHAAGIVISDIPLERIAPMRMARGSKIASQWVGEELESLGLIKFDILAIAALTIIKRAVKMVKENYDIDIDIYNLPVNDDKTFELYRKGFLTGVFQCEQGGMQNTMKQIGVDSFDDIMAAIALYRPGPMDSIPDYCSRKRGESKVDYFHPSVEKYVKKYLEKTQGIIVYQEQIMQICNSLSGFRITDGYIMIKAIGKKKQYLMDKFKKQFINGCVDNKVPQDVAEQYWDKFVVPFSGYGFNMAHSCCYGYNSYLTAYLKANYPDEFACAFLSVEMERGKYDDMGHFEKSISKECNIELLPRDINKCKMTYMVEVKKDVSKGIRRSQIRPSMLSKGVGKEAAENIVANQPYKNLREVAEKTDWSIVDTKSILGLAESGYFGKSVAKDPSKAVKEFANIRADLKTNAKKGIQSVDIFAN